MNCNECNLGTDPSTPLPNRCMGQFPTLLTFRIANPLVTRQCPRHYPWLESRVKLLHSNQNRDYPHYL